MSGAHYPRAPALLRAQAVTASTFRTAPSAAAVEQNIGRALRDPVGAKRWYVPRSRRIAGSWMGDVALEREELRGRSRAPATAPWPQAAAAGLIQAEGRAVATPGAVVAAYWNSIRLPSCSHRFEALYPWKVAPRVRRRSRAVVSRLSFRVDVAVVLGAPSALLAAASTASLPSVRSFHLVVFVGRLVGRHLAEARSMPTTSASATVAGCSTRCRRGGSLAPIARVPSPAALLLVGQAGHAALATMSRYRFTAPLARRRDTGARATTQSSGPCANGHPSRSWGRAWAEPPQPSAPPSLPRRCPDVGERARAVRTRSPLGGTHAPEAGCTKWPGAAGCDGW